VLVGVAEEIRDTMEITGFWGFFTTCASMDEALAALAERALA
jgi:anti-sigma B factor antagonist